jgi:hypothetical protein
LPGIPIRAWYSASQKPRNAITVRTTTAKTCSAGVIGSRSCATLAPARTASRAYRASAVAAPRPAAAAGWKPRRTPSSMIRTATGPTGIAMA